MRLASTFVAVDEGFDGKDYHSRTTPGQSHSQLAQGEASRRESRQQKVHQRRAIIRDFSPRGVGITCVSESQDANQGAIDRTQRALLA